MKTTYIYHNGIAKYTIIDNDGSVYIGEAHCHPEDVDMMSEKTGLQIAEIRANIKFLKHLIKESKKELKALKDFHSLLKFNPYYNKENREVKLLIKEIRRREKDIKENKNSLKEMKDSLIEYIAEKEKFYQKIRRNRNRGQK